MSGVAPQIDYTARTFDTIRSQGLQLLQARVTTFVYNDMIATGLAPAVIDVLAWFQEQNAYYYNRRFRNSLLALADTREAMVVLTRAQGYTMRPTTSASVSVVATPQPPQATPITIPQGTQISAAGLIFQAKSDYVIPANKTYWPDGTTDDIIVFTQGASQTDTFTSTGNPFQQFQLSQPGTINGSVMVSILNQTWDDVPSLVFVEGDQRGRDSFQGEGTDFQSFQLSLLNAIVDPNDEDDLIVLVTPPGQPSSAAVQWTQVPDFTGAPQEFTVSQTIDGVTNINFGQGANGASPLVGAYIDVLYLIVGAQQRYQLTYDTNNQGTIIFGDGVFGIIPPTGAIITVTYSIGGGPAGNVPSNTLNTTILGVLSNGSTTPVLIQNFEAGRGGEPEETVDHARFYCPLQMQANQRAVTQTDFTMWAATYFDPVYGAPSYASAYLKQDIPELNTVEVALWSRDQNGQVSDANTPLKDAVQMFLNTKRTICTSVEMVDGTVVVFDIDAQVVIQQGFVVADVFAAIQSAVQTFFNSSQVMPGIDLSISQLYDAISTVSGVISAEITSVVGSILVTCVVTTDGYTPAVGDGATNLFQGQFALDEGTQIVPGSIVITDGTQQVIDNGTGAFNGNINLSDPPNTIGNECDYETGTWSVSFASPPAVGAIFFAQAKMEAFFPNTEDLGASDGSVTEANGATQYYPLVARAPRGLWSGDQYLIVDAFQVGTTNEVRGTLPTGIISGTLFFTDHSGQQVRDVLTVGTSSTIIDAFSTVVGTIDYITGAFDFTFDTPPALPITAKWHTNTVAITMPADYLPLTPGRVYIWGGFDVGGTQSPPGQIVAYDDGEGNIAGNVQAGGTIDYESGEINFVWNTVPPPGIAGGQLFTATISPTPNGTNRQFTFSLAPVVPHGADLTPTGWGGEGRLHLLLSALSTPGFSLADAWDNWQGGITGASLNRIKTNVVTYALGTGTLTFDQPLPVGTPTTFPVQITDVATFLYSGFVYFVKTPGGPGLDKGLFADNNGEFWGPPAGGPADSFPTDKLDYLRGRYFARLAGSPVVAGREIDLTYDALTGVPPALDIVIQGNEVATMGALALTQKVPNAGAIMGSEV
jgi:Baseplate J-like protein